MNALEIEQIYKKFGTHEIIKGVSLTVPEHSVFGFIGQNGAGKTTTMKMILGLLKMDSGTIKVFQEPITYGETKTNQYIGYLPDVPEYYNFMTSIEYLKLCGDITGMKNSAIFIKSEELLSLVGLEEAKKKKIGGFSRGMKQRLGIAQALLNDPKLLICDEPTSALDPVGRKDILDILRKVTDKTTVIFSTHILSDVEKICDNIAILKDGTIALQGTLSEIKTNHMVDSLKIEFSSVKDYEMFYSNFKDSQTKNIEEIDKKCLVIHSCNIEKTHSFVIELLYKLNILPTCLELQEPNLESLFLEVVK